jgi:hypothetical protein
MKYTYYINKQSLACILILALLLQSCSNTTAHMPQAEENLLVTSPLPTKDAILAQTFITKEGYEVTFYPKGNKWKAEVIEKSGKLSRVLRLYSKT